MSGISPPIIRHGGLLLTPVEIICLKLRCEGLKTKEMGTIVEASPRTIEAYFSAAVRRNRCKTCFQLVAIFART